MATSEFRVGTGWTDPGLHPRAVSDVNGDGRADIVGFGHEGSFVALGSDYDLF